MCNLSLSVCMYLSARQSGKKALVFVAHGSEDTEVVATVDVLRRGGIDVKLCSVEKNDQKPLICANNIRLLPDVHVDDVQKEQFDAIIIPGGKERWTSRTFCSTDRSWCLGSKGTDKIASCEKAGALLLDHYQRNKLIAAICAGPLALSAHLFDADEHVRQHDITCYPDVARSLTKKFKSVQLDRSVVDSEVNHRHIITSQGPATAIEFALKILSRLTDAKNADEIRQKLLV